MFCLSCKRSITVDEPSFRVGSGAYQHVKCPKFTPNPKGSVMATPVKPAPAKPAAPKAVATPAPAPAKPAAPKAVAPAPAPAKPAAPKAVAAPKAPPAEETAAPEKKTRKRREGPAYAEVNIDEYLGNTITFGPAARDEAGNAVNPKRGKSAERFALYVDGMTVQAALEAGVKVPDIRWDLAHDFIVLQ